MVSFKSLAAVAVAGLSALPGTSAYIYNMTAPATGVSGESVTATLYTSIYIQNYDDFGIVWGLTPRITCDNCVGQKLEYTNLVGDGAPTVPPSGNFTLDVKLPEGLSAGKYYLVAAVPYLVGASGITDVKFLNSSITIS